MNHRPRKRFGQNFLHDEHVIRKIIDSIQIRPEDHIVEIGPGQGALTRHLVNQGKRLDLIELDRDLVVRLSSEMGSHDHLHLHQADILKFDLGDIAEPGFPLRVVGNLPYNISTPVIFRLLKYQSMIRDMVFMLQLEVVNRMAAEPGNRTYGRLGLMVQYYCRVEHLFDVPANAFTPRPKVVSAIVRLTPHTTPPVEARDVGCLQNVIRTAFTQRRKTLKNSLKTLISEDAWTNIPVDNSQRPENISLADYVRISDSLSAD
ncbi:MAG: 16S rRNA (adenine(1518)-N(6)/adenine(1519)-N(6))-dimethyltransferase RsmA [Pseudohongiellaceae bacterium]